MTFEEAESYVKQVRWQYAKTYVTAPHEYTCLDWNEDLHAQMVDFAYFIKINGYTEIFGKKAFRVLKIGEMKYWTMDSPLENTNLVNRTFVDDSRKEKIIKFVQSEDFVHKKGMSLADVEQQMKEKKIIT
ncbi:MAG: hypothetical protein J5798_11575 [Spirochaetaceae bacterium]|nr:hypothetical protein [Spirochaetaceae bacterium]